MGSVGLLMVLLVAPATLNLAYAQPPGSVGHHGSVQAGAAAPPLLRLSENNGSPVATGTEQDNDLKAVDPNVAPAKSQHISFNGDGQYSFGYSAASSARQERRHPDGSVQGSYSYQDPDGKTVEISYTADANGFNAYGENVPPRQVVFAPYPVQDTPEVAEARAKFLDYYQREWNHRKALEAKENATKEAQALAQSAEPSSLPVVTVPDTAEVIMSAASDDVGDAESEVIRASDASDDAPAVETNQGSNNEAPSAPLPGSSLYNVQFTVGGQNPGSGIVQPAGAGIGQNAGSVIGQIGGAGNGLIDAKTRTGASGPGYFYYVGVGGLPNYVTTATRSNAPVSVRASQIGAIPAAAIHDAQTPHYGGSVLKTKPFPPVYVEVGQDYTDSGKTAGNTVSFQNFGSNTVNNQGLVVPSYPLYFPFYGFRVNPYQK